MLSTTDWPVYLDAAATTPVHPTVLETMLPYFTDSFGNPSSEHLYGQRAKQAIELATSHLAALLNVQPDEIIFTSGATEAINIAIKGYFLANSNRGNHIITVKTEHAVVLETCRFLEQLGAEITFLDVNEFGEVDIPCFLEAIREDTLLACVMHVNNETGLIQDIKTISEICLQNNITFFTDATQAIGHIPVDYSSPGISLVALSGHKFMAPKGIGALICKKGILIEPLFHGGGQQKSVRPGSLPTPLIVGLGAAAHIINKNLSGTLQKLASQSRLLEQALKKELGLAILLPQLKRAPHIIPCLAPRTTGSQFLQHPEIQKRIYASTGSACSAGVIRSSHVIEHTIGKNAAERFIRISHFLPPD